MPIRHSPAVRARFGPACLLIYLPNRCGGKNLFTMVELYRQQKQQQKTLHRYRAILVASSYMRHEFHRHGVAADRIGLVPYFLHGVTPDAEQPAERRLQTACSLSAVS